MLKIRHKNSLFIGLRHKPFDQLDLFDELKAAKIERVVILLNPLMLGSEMLESLRRLLAVAKYNKVYIELRYFTHTVELSPTEEFSELKKLASATVSYTLPPSENTYWTTNGRIVLAHLTESREFLDTPTAVIAEYGLESLFAGLKGFGINYRGFDSDVEAEEKPVTPVGEAFHTLFKMNQAMFQTLGEFNPYNYNGFFNLIIENLQRPELDVLAISKIEEGRLNLAFNPPDFTSIHDIPGVIRIDCGSAGCYPGKIAKEALLHPTVKVAVVTSTNYGLRVQLTKGNDDGNAPLYWIASRTFAQLKDLVPAGAPLEDNEDHLWVISPTLVVASEDFYKLLIEPALLKFKPINAANPYWPVGVTFTHPSEPKPPALWLETPQSKMPETELRDRVWSQLKSYFNRYWPNSIEADNTSAAAQSGDKLASSKGAGGISLRRGSYTVATEKNRFLTLFYFPDINRWIDKTGAEVGSGGIVHGEPIDALSVISVSETALSTFLNPS